MITYILIATIAIISFTAFNRKDLFYKLMFFPYETKQKGQWYRFLTHAFTHANWEHLIFNMLTFFFFGVFVEQSFEYFFGNKGMILYLTEFLLAGIISSIPSYLKHKDNPSYTAVGASGAVSAILFTSILLHPLNKIYLMFIPIGIPAFIFGFLYLGYSAYMSKRNIDNIGHDAHFWGAVVGIVFPVLLKFELLNDFIQIIKTNFGL
jgi:membrane associated rhomboid family serine protease